MTDTSHAAFESILPDREYLHGKVLEALKDNPEGLTSEELADFTGVSYASIQPRTSELRHDQGLIVDSGLRRRARSGRNIIVWRMAA